MSSKERLQEEIAQLKLMLKNDSDDMLLHNLIVRLSYILKDM